MAISNIPKTSLSIKKKPQESSRKDKHDDRQARWGRDRHDGFKVGKFYNAPPMFFTQDHHPLWLTDNYRGRTAFMICGGPSFGEIDHDKLAQPGILTMGMNNAPRTFRPDLWASVDSPDHFLLSIYMDPKIMKFVPVCSAGKPLFDNDNWQWTNLKVGDSPNMVYYKRNERFRAKQYLWEDTINWGNHKDYGGGRSIMLATIRILFLLGFRTVNLLGCDFNMSEEHTYHFDQTRRKDSVRGNTSTYGQLNERFAELRPLFEREKFNVYNCNPESGLRVFEHVSFDAAIKRALNEFGNIDTKNERTQGLYDEDKPKSP